MISAATFTHQQSPSFVATCKNCGDSTAHVELRRHDSTEELAQKSARYHEMYDFTIFFSPPGGGAQTCTLGSEALRCTEPTIEPSPARDHNFAVKTDMVATTASGGDEGVRVTIYDDPLGFYCNFFSYNMNPLGSGRSSIARFRRYNHCTFVPLYSLNSLQLFEHIIGCLPL